MEAMAKKIKKNNNVDIMLQALMSFYYNPTDF